MLYYQIPNLNIKKTPKIHQNYLNKHNYQIQRFFHAQKRVTEMMFKI